MKLIIDIPEARYKDIQRIAEVQLESNHFRTAEQIIAKGMPIEQEPKTDMWSIKEVADALEKHGLLEQEPCEDCISRSDAIEVMKCHWEEMLHPVNLRIQEDLKKLAPVQPKVEQEPKTDISKRICDFVAVKEEDGNVRKVPVLNQKIFNQSINDVLDKIKAEIADLDDADYDYEGYFKAVTDALQIIDKYRGES